jgi:hypothetical protein
MVFKLNFFLDFVFRAGKSGVPVVAIPDEK